LYEQALAIERDRKDQAAEALTLNSLGFVYWMTDQYEKAIGWYEKALVIQRELKDRAGEAITLDRLGFAYRKLNQTERAIQSYEQALTIERELKDRLTEARTLDSLASSTDDRSAREGDWLVREGTGHSARAEGPRW
jgi:tetratricopeptide (TPR) repeat protein